MTDLHSKFKIKDLVVHTRTGQVGKIISIPTAKGSPYFTVLFPNDRGMMIHADNLQPTTETHQC
jgi:hypothetical protein